jgi:hypothetical protein
MIPMSSYVVRGLQSSHVLAIRIFESFDNKDFSAESFEFLLSNHQLQFKSATLRVRTSLTGLRWLMHEWFFSCLITTVWTITIVVCVACLILIILVKQSGFLGWL